MAVVGQDVADSVPCFARRFQRVGMVAVGKHAAAAAGEGVEALCEADAEALHGARKRDRAFGLDDEMQVIPLDGVVDDANAETLAGVAQGGLDHLRATIAAEVADPRLEPHGDVHRVSGGEIRTAEVRNTRTDETWMRPRPGSARARSLASANRELERPLPSRSPHPEK